MKKRKRQTNPEVPAGIDFRRGIRGKYYGALTPASPVRLVRDSASVKRSQRANGARRNRRKTA